MTAPTLLEAAKAALEAMDCLKKGDVAVWSLGGSRRISTASISLRAAIAEAEKAEPVSLSDTEYENEHPAARKMRLAFEGKYGKYSNLMRAANHWFRMRTEFNDAWNRERETPITEDDVHDAENAMLAAAPKEPT